MSPNPSNGIITQYMMEYRRSVDSSYTSVTLSATTLMYTVSGLDVDTEYQFRVRASTSVGDGPFTDLVTQETGILSYHLQCYRIKFLTMMDKILYIGTMQVVNTSSIPIVLLSMIVFICSQLMEGNFE